MKSKRLREKIDISLLILALLVVITAAASLWTGGWQRTVSGLTKSVHLLNTVWLRLILGFNLGGLIQVLVSHELIVKWLGPTSGLKGICIGSYAGIFMMGGPFIRLPVIASIYRGGAGVGPVIALLTGNELAIFGLIIWQIPFLGVGIPLARYIVCLFIPPLVGLLGELVYRLMGYLPYSDPDNVQESLNLMQAQDISGKAFSTLEKKEKA